MAILTLFGATAGLRRQMQISKYNNSGEKTVLLYLGYYRILKMPSIKGSQLHYNFVLDDGVSKNEVRVAQ